MELVPMKSYYRTYDGSVFSVSRWEGHPSREAHRIFAERLAGAVAARPELAAFPKGGISRRSR